MNFITLKKTLAITFLSLSLNGTYAQDALAPISYDAYAAILKQHVNVQGTVNYARLKDHKEELYKVVDYISQYEPTKEWSEEKEKAYWLNVYNINVLKSVVSNYPINSVNDVKGIFSEKTITFGENETSLDAIEKNLLKIGGARVLFGICKGAYSSPKISNQVFTEANVDGRLNALGANFVNDRSKNQVASSTLKLNDIFKTYSKEFKKEGDLIEFLNTFAMRDIMEDAKISYMKFDWKLNK